MPFHKKTNFRHRRNKGAKKSAYVANKRVTMLRRQVEGDKKSLDTTQISYPVTNTATVTWLSNVPQYADADPSFSSAGYYHLGLHISIKGSIFANNNLGTIEPATVRYIVFRDLQQTTAGTLPTVNDVLQDTTYVDSPILYRNRKRFKILADKYIAVGPSPSARTFKIFKKFRVRTGVDYVGMASVPRENNIYVLAMSDQSALANQPSMYWWCRYAFVQG